jgi:hypothetical protein
VRRFFIELAAALALSATVAAGLEWVYRDYRTFVDRRLDGLAQVADRVEGLVVGGSHTGAFAELGLEAGDLVYNTCIGGQDLRRSFLLARALLPRLPRLRYVIVQLDYDSVGYNLASGGQEWMDRQYFPYTGYLDDDGILPRLMARSSFLRANRDLGYFPRFLGSRSDGSQPVAPGAEGLLPAAIGSHPGDDAEACRLRAVEHSRVKFFRSLVPENRDVLREFALLAEQSEARFVFVNTPKASCYSQAYDPATAELGRQVITEAVARWGIRFVDLFGAPGFDDLVDYVDYDHLSSSGARKAMALIRGGTGVGSSTRPQN